jgi:transcriptional regulator with XRE-family HTH domain
MLLDEMGNRIRSRREKLGLKQHDIAHALQISPQAVSKWERGENAPDLVTLCSLVKLLGVTTDWLLGRNAENLDIFEATVFTSSVYGAFGKSLEIEPKDFAAWANGFFFQLTEAVLRYDGVPIKYMGDKFLCFFSGADQQKRAVSAMKLAREMVTEDLKFGISSGEIYLGSIGHPEYARPDIMGEVVNIAFLAMGWAEASTKSGAAVTMEVTEKLDTDIKTGGMNEITFKGIDHPVRICEIIV